MSIYPTDTYPERGIVNSFSGILDVPKPFLSSPSGLTSSILCQNDEKVNSPIEE